MYISAINFFKEAIANNKNNFAAMAVRRGASNFNMLVQLIQYEGGGDWRSINTEIPSILKITAEDIQRVAKKYLSDFVSSTFGTAGV